MNTQLTVEHLLELIDALPKERAYDYVIAGDNKAVLHFVNIADQTISIDKENVNGTIKSANITSETINIIANGIKAYIPFTMDSILNGSGSSRSAWETIIANTSEFYKCMINRNKHLVWVPDSPHEIGQICEISEKELPSGTNNYLEPSIANFITQYDKQKYSFEALVNIFKRIHDEAKENRKRVQAINMYGILYAPHLLEYKVNGPDSIAARALGNDNIGSMGDEMGRGIAIGMILREHLKPTISPNKNKTLYAATSTSYLPYLTALRTKPFMLLAGISGTGKSRIVRKLAQATNTKEYANEEVRWKDNRPDNFQLIQVKPNWHNSMDVAGFLSNIPTPHYVFTDFVRFIVKAWQHPETPYFLCLDEMNLAPVEEYFAEFLSAIESRAWDENGHYTTDPIISPFKDFGKEVCEAMLKELLGEAHHTEANPLAIQFEEKGLTLPPNLMVMGTVNMDETTFSFSRKVLDRAMSVDMNEVKYDDFLEGKTELMPLLTVWNEKLVNRPQKAQEVQGEIDSQKVIDYLKAVNELLDSTPFKLGYRAANEAILYVAASQEFAQGTFSLEKALDEFTMMKILSRIEGDDSRLAIDENDERLQKAGLSESPLDNGEQSLTLLNGLRAIVRQHIGTETETEKKINHMYTTLCREHFVSYWA